jgi:predicted amidohydrolase YtcJ
MAAAVSRQTRAGQTIGADEALTPEEALELHLAVPGDLPRQRRIAVGEPADLVLLDRPWSLARNRLKSGDVRATIVAGDCLYQAPA